MDANAMKVELARRISELSAGRDAELQKIEQAREILRLAEINVQRLEGGFAALRGLLIATEKTEEKTAQSGPKTLKLE